MSEPVPDPLAELAARYHAALTAPCPWCGAGAETVREAVQVAKDARAE